MKKTLLALLACGFAFPALAQSPQYQFPTAPWSAFAPAMVQCGQLYAANFNTTADQAIQISVPSALYRIQAIRVANASVSMTTAVGGVYTAASKAGTSVVANTQVFSALTNNTPNTAGNGMQMTLANAQISFGGPSQGANAQKQLYFSLTTPQGAAATADISVICQLQY